MPNFTIADIVRILFGFVLFLPFAICPGYVVGALSNGLRFRERSTSEKLLISAPLSIATVPLLIYLGGRLGGMPAAWSAIASCGVAFLVLFTRDVMSELRPLAGSLRPLLAALFWIIIAIAVLVDLEWNGRLYIASATFDYAVRNEVISSITRTGVLPTNPFFFPGHAVPLRYHHFFYLPCSMVEVLSGGHITSGNALVAGTLWCGLGLMCLVCLYVRYFRTSEWVPVQRNIWAGIGMLPIMGLDVIPVCLMMASGVIFFTLDKWNEDIAGWFDSLLWAPHYVAATIACLTGFLLLWSAGKTSRTLAGAASVPIMMTAGAAFACCAGLGIYIALVFAAAMAGYAGVALWKGWRNDVRNFVGAGAVATILALPYLTALYSSDGANAGSAMLSPTVRTFKIAELVLASMHVNWNVIAAVNFVLLPVNYALEFGVLFLTGIIQARRFARRRIPLGRKEWAAIVLIACPTLICTFFRSSVIANNDLGWRGFLIPQFVLLLWSIGPVRASIRQWSRAANRKRWGSILSIRSPFIAALWLGMAGAILGAAINRGYIAGVDQGIVTTRNWLIRDQDMAKRLFSLRETYEWIDNNTAVVALIQPNPEFLDIAYGLYSQRASLAGDEHCGTAFGGSAAACTQLLSSLLPLFTGSKTVEASDLNSVCSKFSLNMVIAKDTDPVWRNHKVGFGSRSRSMPTPTHVSSPVLRAANHGRSLTVTLTVRHRIETFNVYA